MGDGAMRKYFLISYLSIIVIGLATKLEAQTLTPTAVMTVAATPSSSYTLNWDNSNQGYKAGGRHFQSSAVMNRRLWIIGGEGNNLPMADVWSSPDGSTWSEATTQAGFSGRWGQATVVFDGGQGRALWVIGGSDNKTFFNDVWQSKDGSTWTEATSAAAFSQRVRASAVVFNHKMWILGGRNSSTILNDVWSSTDGKTWTQVTPAAAFPPRYSASLIVYNNALYLMAGQGNSGPLNDVWTSTDGATWTDLLVNPGFPPRASQSAVVYNGSMWILGGHDVTTQTVFADAWWSNNGSQWYQASDPKDYTPRWAQTSEVFDQSIWMITGASGTQMKPVDYADIWSGTLSTTSGFSSALVVGTGLKTTTPTATVTTTLTTTPAPIISTPTPTATIGTVPVAYPNPCTSDHVNLNLPLHQPGDVKVEFFTVGSRHVRTCVFHQQPVGQDVTVTLADDSGVALANGLYFVRVTTPEGSHVLKLLVIR